MGQFVSSLSYRSKARRMTDQPQNRTSSCVAAIRRAGAFFVRLLLLGFAINGGDASQDGAAIEVSQIEQLMAELTSNGVNVGDSRIDERDGTRYQVFFAIAPDGLCYYFHQPVIQD